MQPREDFILTAEERDGEARSTGGSPHFSVVIPLYNERPYVRRAVDSVLRQSFEEFELIVVDDGSTDGGAETLTDVADARFRLVRQENAGEGPARNRGISEARAEWVALLDADDCWLPEHLFETASVIRAFPGASLVATGYREVRGVSEVALWKTETSKIRSIDYFLEASRNIGRVNSSNASLRREVIEKLGGFGNFKAGADLECWARIALFYPVAISDRVTSIYFRGTGGVMEQLQGGRRPPLSPSIRLSEISPSVSLLCAVMEREPSRRSDPSIRAYVNSRVLNGLRGVLFNRDVAGARRLAELFTPPLEPRFALARAAARLPEPILLLALDSFQTCKSTLRAALGRAG